MPTVLWIVAFAGTSYAPVLNALIVRAGKKWAPKDRMFYIGTIFNLPL